MLGSKQGCGYSKELITMWIHGLDKLSLILTKLSYCKNILKISTIKSSATLNKELITMYLGWSYKLSLSIILMK
jgi:hypothetical protein